MYFHFTDRDIDFFLPRLVKLYSIYVCQNVYPTRFDPYLNYSVVSDKVIFR